MPQPKKAPRFGGDPAHHRMILANLSTELFRHGRITTTHAKAKTVQPLAEKMITFAKRGDIHARRQVLRVVRDRDVVHKLFADIGPAFAERDGGYTRVLKLGPRKGDAAPMALIELVEGVAPRAGEGDLAEAPRRRWSLRRRRGSTLSQSAQEREELRLAAVDRGEDLIDDEPVHVDEVEAAPEDDDAYAGVGADPEEVERRLAAEEASVTDSDEESRLAADEDSSGSDSDEERPVTGPVPSDDQDTPAPERPGGVRPDTATPDPDADPDGDGPVEGPIPAREQDSPPDVNE